MQLKTAQELGRYPIKVTFRSFCNFLEDNHLNILISTRKIQKLTCDNHLLCFSLKHRIIALKLQRSHLSNSLNTN